MAAPHVSGVLALNMALRPSDSLERQLDRLVQSSRKTETLRLEARSRGVVNLAQSLLMEEIPFPPILLSRSEEVVAKFEGDTVVFSADVESTLPLRFQWYFEGVELIGGTGAELRLESIVESDGGRYRLRAENDDGAVELEFVLRVLVSDEALVEGLDADSSISVFSRAGSPWTLVEDELSRGGSHIQVDQPEKYESTNLSAVVRGPGELRFLWRFANGSDYLRGATCTVGGESKVLSPRGDEWQIARFTLEEERDYELLWGWRGSGDIRADGGQLVVDYLNLYPIGQVPPTVYQHPKDQSVQPYSSPSFYVFADGQDLNYTWYKDGEEFVSRNDGSLWLREVGVEDEGSYHVVVANEFGSEESRSGNLDIDESQTPARFTERDVSFSGKLGASLDLSVGHVGSPPIIYQWYRGYSPIPGETGPVLSIDKLRLEDAGEYRLTIENGYGNLQHSDRVWLTVVDKDLSPDALLEKRDLNRYRIREGEPFENSHWLGYRTESMEFQWYLNGKPLTGENSLELKYDSMTVEQSGIYSLEVKNSAGSFREDVYQIRVDLGVSEALDIEGYEWWQNNIGDSGWRYGQREVSMDGEDAVEFSREYPFTGTSWYDNGSFSTAIGTLVSGPRNLSVHWKRTSVSSYFEVVFGSLGVRYSSSDPTYYFREGDAGIGEWAKNVIHVPEGDHLVWWNFQGDDPEQIGWLDRMEETDAPAIAAYVPKVIFADSERGFVRIEAWGKGTLSYQWFRNGELLEAETSNEIAVASSAVKPEDEYTLEVVSEFGRAVSSPIRFLHLKDVAFVPESNGVPLIS